CEIDLSPGTVVFPLSACPGFTTKQSVAVIFSFHSRIFDSSWYEPRASASEIRSTSGHHAKSTSLPASPIPRGTAPAKSQPPGYWCLKSHPSSGHPALPAGTYPESRPLLIPTPPGQSALLWLPLRPAPN